LHNGELYDFSQNDFLVIKSWISRWGTFGGLKCIQSFGEETWRPHKALSIAGKIILKQINKK
jgi:hypothetical protein